MKSVGDNIRKIRLGLKISQSEAAKKLKISTPAFCKMETGQTDLNISRLLQISKTFKVPVIQLITGNPGEDHAASELVQLKLELQDKEQELNKLRKKIVDLYEKLGM